MQHSHLRCIIAKQKNDAAVRLEDCISSCCQSAWLMIRADARRRESLFSRFCLSLRSTGVPPLSSAQGTPPASGTLCGPDRVSEQNIKIGTINSRWWHNKAFCSDYKSSISKIEPGGDLMLLFFLKFRAD